MIDYIKINPGLQGIVVVLNYHQPKLSMYIQSMIKLLCNIFPSPNFWTHVAFIWTRYYYYLPKEERDRKITILNEFMPEVLKLVKETNGNVPIGNFPTFFVDVDFDRNDQFTRREINNLILWIHNLDPVDVDMVNMADPYIKEIITPLARVLLPTPAAAAQPPSVPSRAGTKAPPSKARISPPPSKARILPPPFRARISPPPPPSRARISPPPPPSRARISPPPPSRARILPLVPSRTGTKAPPPAPPARKEAPPSPLRTGTGNRSAPALPVVKPRASTNDDLYEMEGRWKFRRDLPTPPPYPA